MLEAVELLSDFRLFSFFGFIAFFLCCEVFERTFFPCQRDQNQFLKNME